MDQSNDETNPAPGTHQAGMTASEIAEHFGVTEKSVRRWALTGCIPAFRAGSRLRFDLEEVEAALRVQASREALDGK